MPYTSDPDRIGVLPAAPPSDEADVLESVGPSLSELLDQLGFDVESSDPVDGLESVGGTGSPTEGMIVRRRDLGLESVGAEDTSLEQLRQSPLIEAAGPVFRQSEEFVFDLYQSIERSVSS